MEVRLTERDEKILTEKLKGNISYGNTFESHNREGSFMRDNKSIWDVIEKRGVVLRDVVNLVGKSCSYNDVLQEVVNDPHYNAQLSKIPSKDFVRVSIILEPISYEEVK
jgi:hypothetical protein